MGRAIFLLSRFVGRTHGPQWVLGCGSIYAEQVMGVVALETE